MMLKFIHKLSNFLKTALCNQKGSFNLGIGFNGRSAQFSMLSYFYDQQAYRRYIVQIALAFYSGRQDEFIWLDLQKRFVNPEKHHIIPYNITKEIIDETSILYRDEPTYIVKDKDGKNLEAETKLWEAIRKKSRYLAVTQELDAMTKLLGTVLLKVNFINPETGDLVNANEPGIVNFEIVHGGFYNVKWGANPYYITHLDFDFTSQSWMNKPANVGTQNIPVSSGLSVAMKPTDTTKTNDTQGVGRLTSIGDVGKISKITWDAKAHTVHGEKGFYDGENPYGVIPAVPFFNQNPGNHFFLPVNEPLLYANHAINLRLTDLNHIAEYQSFGQAVVKGIERPLNNRMGRPTDDFNVRGGSRSFGFGIGGDLGPTGEDRTRNTGFGFMDDGNSNANSLGFSLGPDSVVSVGETGDFKFVHPNADIGGLTKCIYTMVDMVRINHGLKPKHEFDTPPSGYGITLEKLGVVEQNKKRQNLFREREQQLFQIVKKLWNVHHDESEEDTFDEDCELEIYYVEPEFAMDPVSKMNILKGEQEILLTGNRRLIRKLYPHLDDMGIEKVISEFRSDRMEQTESDMEIENTIADLAPELPEEGSAPAKSKIPKPKIANRAEHAKQSSIQPGKNGDTRKSDKAIRREKK